jgi:ABC-2 type transport system ATP-binding protein
MAKIIQLKNIYKNYEKKKVLEDINFELPEGKFTTLIGCNGAGKSTTLRIIAGTEKITTGDVEVCGEDPFGFSFSARKDIFFVHENYQLDMNLSALDMVKIYKDVFPRWSNKIFNQLSKDRKISLKKKYSELSRGQKMQFLLMIGLAARTKILLLDEVTSVIDIDGQRYFLDLLKKYTEEGGTVVLTTNILSEVNGYTDHLILLQDTKLKINKPVEDIQKDFVILNKVHEHPIFEELRAAKIRMSAYDNRELYIVPIDLVEKHSSIEKCLTSHTPQLEDILIYHFKFKESFEDEQLVA